MLTPIKTIKLSRLLSHFVFKPTLDYGNACSYSGSPYIGQCDYFGAYEILNHIYPGLQVTSMFS